MLRGDIVNTSIGDDQLFAVYGDSFLDSYIDFKDGLLTYDPSEGTKHYRIRVGDYLPDDRIWAHQYLVFLNNNDSGPAGNSTFSNVQIYEDIKPTSVVQSESRDSEVEHYVYNGNRLALTLRDDATIKNRYTYAPGTDNLLVDEAFDETGQLDETQWAVTDHLGAVHDLIDNSHALIEHREYDAFGEITDVVNSSNQSIEFDQMASDIAFAGREWDNEAELYYNRARWYDADLGRFISESPIGIASGDPNFYRYASNDPINFRDPSGLTQEGNPLDNLASRGISIDNQLSRMRRDLESRNSFFFDPPGGFTSHFTSPFSSDSFEALVSLIQTGGLGNEDIGDHGLSSTESLVTVEGLRLNVGSGRT